MVKFFDGLVDLGMKGVNFGGRGNKTDAIAWDRCRKLEVRDRYTIATSC
ncbi:hypothetical protein [Coleofasciculus sp. FACHB-1120]|nr:hypothetical protein [Coleofasciculus sp. FACHB-1120]MBD2741391.1 hypothetical protein [Coleofasciculus sp. FACHB-1120]